MLKFSTLTKHVNIEEIIIIILLLKVLFIADEVQTGLGRTGRYYIYSHLT